MDLAIILLDLFTFFVGISLGLFVFSRSPKNRIFQIFAITVLGMAGWNLSIFLLLAELGPAVIPGKTTFSFGVLLITGFAWFVFHFPTKMKHAKFFSWLFGILGLIFFIIPLTPWFLTWVEIVDGMITGDLHPVLFGLVTSYSLVAYLVTFVILLVRAIKAKGVDKIRLWQVLLGFALFLFPMLTTQLFMPMVFNDFRWNNLGPAFSIFLVAFLANAIVSYRLLDIRWIVSKSILFSVLSGIVLWMVFAATFLVSSIVDPSIGVVISALVVVIAYHPISKLLERIVSKFAHKGSYNPEVATKEVFEVVRTTGDLDVLSEKISKLFSGYFAAEQIGLIVFEVEKDKVLSAQSQGFNASLTRQSKSLLEIAKKYGHQIVEKGEMEWRKEFYSAGTFTGADKKYLPLFESLGIETLVPFVVEKRVIGFMIFGKRRYDRALRSRDIQFLDLIRSGISPALENAAKYAEMKKLYEQLAQADRVKSEFIDVVSHRFRTPLSAIRWNVETVLDSARLNKDSKDMLADSHERTMFLVTTLDGLFDTLELESGKLKLNVTNFDFQKALEPILKTYTEKAKEKGLNFAHVVPKVTIAGDQKRLMHVVDTLLSNAMLYTQKGEVDLAVGKKDGMPFIRVSDTGIGIPKKDQPKIFEKFFRASNAVQAYADGQGLGLYLVKALVEKHKGKLELVSEEGKGTSVTVWLPKTK